MLIWNNYARLKEYWKGVFERLRKALLCSDAYFTERVWRIYFRIEKVVAIYLFDRKLLVTVEHFF